MTEIKQQTAQPECANAHPDLQTTFIGDVIAPLQRTVETLYWLEEVFSTIAKDPNVSRRIKQLANMGAYLAIDTANITDIECEHLAGSIKKSGAA